jgi:hypothetical protein
LRLRLRAFAFVLSVSSESLSIEELVEAVVNDTSELDNFIFFVAVESIESPSKFKTGNEESVVVSSSFENSGDRLADRGDFGIGISPHAVHVDLDK